ncbi:HAD-IIIC family phosphatase [Eubacterium ventriosum]|jgi:FkbH-like protein|uniref:HAD-IIIC family phosphatase n=1 Tax=Eubacterium ventriosum TaxID=39496 RepID=UPI003520563E
MIKCVIWDLDNTVWNGILLESEQVIVKDKIVKLIKNLDKIGIINSISSKNEMDAAMNRLRYEGIDEFFVYPQINWNSKAHNIKQFISKLHIKAKDIVFVDDNEIERKEVKTVIDEITVLDPNKPEDIMLLENLLKSNDNSNQLISRRELYKIEEKRIEVQEKFNGSNADFLKSCNIVVEISTATASAIDRIEELINRTSQLNSTGIKYSKDEIKNMVHSNEYDVFLYNVHDKYGSYGDSALMICGYEEGSYIIKQLIVSCRLLGKGISNTLLYLAYNKANEVGKKELKASYIKTKHNKQMRMLYVMNNMNLEGDYFKINIAEQDIKCPSWITIVNNI